ncbi:MAG: PEP-CTERM sorting domain-containing protein [Desulfobacteraceae bacterium]|nr:MAG: PEP-CTERM sorting domain-containing protein [Desulfobacteraceae bacterium]
MMSISSSKGFSMKRLTLTIMLLFTIIIACPSLSSATLMYDVNSSYSLTGLGSFTGSASYSYTDSSNASFTVSLTNTSPAANEGYITAMAFLLPSTTYQSKIESIFMSSSTSDEFDLLFASYKKNPLNTSPFQFGFDFGAGIGKSWEGGGKPGEGIGVGSTETFTFSMTGKGLDLLSLNDFTQQYGGHNVIAALRFKGFENGGSDKVLGELGGGAQVPEPATLLLFGSGILGYSLLKRRSGSFLQK